MKRVKEKSNRRIFLIAIVGCLLAINFTLIAICFESQKELARMRTIVAQKTKSEQVAGFTKFFVDKVLNGRGAIDFETRLQLENAIRNLNDAEILAQWKIFTESKTESEIQTEISKLLQVLMAKANG
jgi:hypothetical protein